MKYKSIQMDYLLAVPAIILGAMAVLALPVQSQERVKVSSTRAWMAQHVAALEKEAGAAAAQGEPQVLLVAGPKYFLLTLTGAEPTITELKTVVRLGESPDPPPPTGNLTIRQEIAKLTKAVADPGAAKAIQESLRFSLEQAKGGAEWAKVRGSISSVLDIISSNGGAEGWADWRVGLAALIDKLAEEGQLTTQAQQVAFMQALLDGLGDATEGAAIDWAVWLPIIKLILEFLFNSFGG